MRSEPPAGEDRALPVLPLLLLDPPPGLELLLEQEGVPFAIVDPGDDRALQDGRIVLIDGRRRRGSGRGLSGITAQHVLIDIDLLRAEGAFDPFEAAIDRVASRMSWRVEGVSLTERIARFDRAAIRHRVMAWLSGRVQESGGLWARLSPFPSPYRSAFNLRVDLDEPYPDDYWAFARARRPLDDCTTHFVSTAAYGDDARVLAELRGLDTQSHGHFHHVYREPAANVRNLMRADAALRGAGIEPIGFAAPGGRWNPGLAAAVESLGYAYASDFHLGHDDVPFVPRDPAGASARVLQVPVHPICEGLFLDAGIDSPAVIARYYRRIIRERIEAGEPAFVYGHPERRLGRFPEVVSAMAREVATASGVWRTTLTAFADWWRWRSQVRWTVWDRGSGRFEFGIASGEGPRYRPVIEIERGGWAASIEIVGSRLVARLDELRFVPSRARYQARPPMQRERGTWSVRRTVREAIDWEKVTPIDALGNHTIRERVKRGLRILQESGGGRRVR